MGHHEMYMETLPRRYHINPLYNLGGYIKFALTLNLILLMLLLLFYFTQPWIELKMTRKYTSHMLIPHKGNMIITEKSRPSQSEERQRTVFLGEKFE